VAVRISQVLIDCRDPQRLAGFWSAVLGWSVIGHEDDGSIEIGSSEAGAMTIILEPVPEPKTVKNRLHIDLRPTGTTQAVELERLRALGATEVDVGQRDVSWIVLADPEGNEFCLLRDRPA
jgi:catechol-2,3-dioxygenase